MQNVFPPINKLNVLTTRVLQQSQNAEKLVLLLQKHYSKVARKKSLGLFEKFGKLGKTFFYFLFKTVFCRKIILMPFDLVG